MEDLSDIGLQNFISLFLTLASCVKNDDVVKDCSPFFDSYSKNSKNLAKIITEWAMKCILGL